MGYIKGINDKIWEQIFLLLSNITDNVYFAIVFVSIIFAIIVVSMKKWIRMRGSPYIIPFGPISMSCVLSVAYMVERLPMIHPRIHLALGTVSGIIQSSPTYAESFYTVTGQTTESSLSIASYLYYLPAVEKEAWVCSPAELYESLFRTLDQIRGSWFLPDVHLTPSGVHSMLFVAVCIFLVVMALAITEEKKTFRILWFLIQALFLIYTTTLCNGAAVCAMLIWFIEEVLFRSTTHPKHESSNNTMVG